MIMMTITCVSVMLAEELRVARCGNKKPISALSETRDKNRRQENSYRKPKEHIALTIYGRRCSFAVKSL